jgi:hypothetical protein
VPKNIGPGRVRFFVGDRCHTFERSILEAREKLDATQLLGSIHPHSSLTGTLSPEV